MQEDTCKKIKKSLRFEKGGEAFYVEIGMENIPSRTETKKVVAFFKTLFEEAIDQLEVPGTPDAAPKAKGSTYGPSAEDVKEAIEVGEKEFEKLMQEWMRKNRRAAFGADTIPDDAKEAVMVSEKEFIVSVLQGFWDILEQEGGTSPATALGPGITIDIAPMYTPGPGEEDAR